MGYDMRLESPTQELLDAKEAGEKAFDDAVEARDQFEWDAVRTRFPDLMVETKQGRKLPGKDPARPWDIRHAKGPHARIGDLPERNAWAMRQSAAFRQAWQGLIGNEPLGDDGIAQMLREHHQGEYHPAGDADVRAEADRLQKVVMATSDRSDPTYFRLNIWGMGRYRDLMESIGMIDWTDAPPWPDQPENVRKVWMRHKKSDNWRKWETEIVPRKMKGAWEEDDPTDPAVIEYEKAHEAVLGFMPDGPGIAGVKLCSNDGWLVTPEECRSALEIWDRLDGDTQSAYATIATTDEQDAKAIAAAKRIEQGAGAAAVDGEGTRVVATLIEPRKPDPEHNYWDAWVAFIRLAEQSGGFRVH